MKRFFIVAFLFVVTVSLTACKHEHSWTDATCTEPKTCSTCGETEGEPLNHVWKEATCTEAATCIVCGEIFGQPMGHNWADATYDEPKTCSNCQETEGDPLKREIPDNFIEGFELAEFDRFNRYASDNGLGDTKIWITGTYEVISSLNVNNSFNVFYTMVTDEEGNQWFMELDADLYSPRETFTDLAGHPVCFVGRYLGFSDVMQAPAVIASSIFDQKTGIIVLCQLYSGEYTD